MFEEIPLYASSLCLWLVTMPLHVVPKVPEYSNFASGTWPPAWHAHLNNCTGVLVENVGVLSPSIEKRYQWHSTGGMGISNPSGVLFHVRNMTVAQGESPSGVASQGGTEGLSPT